MITNICKTGLVIIGLVVSGTSLMGQLPASDIYLCNVKWNQKNILINKPVLLSSFNADKYLSLIHISPEVFLVLTQVVFFLTGTIIIRYSFGH